MGRDKKDSGGPGLSAAAPGALPGAAALRAAARASLPVLAAYLVLGAGFGLLMQQQGHGWWWALLMSLTVYAGSLQYVAVDLLTGGASLLTAFFVSLAVNFRHLFYGIAMQEPYRDTGRARPYLIFALTDETFSLVCSPQTAPAVPWRDYAFFLSLLHQSYWVAGTALGSLLGGLLPFSLQGIEFSMTALFTVVMLRQWETQKNRLPILTGFGVSLLSLLLIGPQGFLIPAMLGITLLLLLERRFWPHAL